MICRGCKTREVGGGAAQGQNGMIGGVETGAGASEPVIEMKQFEIMGVGVG